MSLLTALISALDLTDFSEYLLTIYTSILILVMMIGSE